MIIWRRSSLYRVLQNIQMCKRLASFYFLPPFNIRMVKKYLKLEENEVFAYLLRH